MNTSERLELTRLAKNDRNVRRLIKKHKGYEERLRLLAKKIGFTSEDQQEITLLKRKKLQSKDELARILYQSRQPLREEYSEALQSAVGM